MKISRIAYSISIVIFMTGFHIACAQNEVDALRYSQLNVGGNARYVAMGGAFGALGGNSGVLSTNPAGIGIYRKSEFSLSPSIYAKSSTSNFLGSSRSRAKSNANFGNLTLILTTPNKKPTLWRNFNFGVGFNRLIDFHERYDANGVNTASSLLDVYKEEIENDEDWDFDPFGAQLAWDLVLVDTFNGDFYTAIPNYGQTQDYTVTTRGRMNETNVTFAGNYNDKLYVGASIGFPSIRYEKESVYTETNDPADSNFVNYFQLEENLTIRGSGINFKGGLIYKMSDYVRLGASIHSPTYLSLNDSWNTTMETEDAGGVYTEVSPEGTFDYRITTPWRTTQSIAFILGKLGLLSIDHEYVDYTAAFLRLRGASSTFDIENTAINDKYRATSNIRVGTEWRLLPFSFRAGFAHYGNPFKSDVTNKTPKQSYSIGFGYRNDNFFADVACVITTYKENNFLYDPTLIEAVQLKHTATNVVSTIGWRF